MCPRLCLATRSPEANGVYIAAEGDQKSPGEAEKKTASVEVPHESRLRGSRRVEATWLSRRSPGRCAEVELPCGGELSVLTSDVLAEQSGTQNMDWNPASSSRAGHLPAEMNEGG